MVTMVVMVMMMILEHFRFKSLAAFLCSTNTHTRGMREHDFIVFLYVVSIAKIDMVLVISYFCLFVQFSCIRNLWLKNILLVTTVNLSLSMIFSRLLFVCRWQQFSMLAQYIHTFTHKKTQQIIKLIFKNVALELQ